MIVDPWYRDWLRIWFVVKAAYLMSIREQAKHWLEISDIAGDIARRAKVIEDRKRRRYG